MPQSHPTDRLELTGTFYVDQSYSEKHAHMLHLHPEAFELLYIASGEGRYQVGHREYAVHPGDLVICNAGTLHGEAPFQAHVMQTYCCALRGLQRPGLPPNCLVRPDLRPVLSLSGEAAAIGQLLPALCSLHASASPDLTSVCDHLAMSIFLLTCTVLRAQEADSKREQDQKTETLVRAITDFLDQHYTEPITLEDVSRALHISPSHLSHLFKRETGLSPIQYVIHRRIGEAQTLLMETRLPIQVIEEQLGFGSSCHLTAMFKKYVGISPRAYRQHFHKP